MNKYDGNLIAIEGIDGSGKGTLISNLKATFENNSDVVFTAEPSDNFYGNKIRERLTSDEEPSPADFFAFLADRYQHCQEIEEYLKSGKTVITDRYDMSTYAYQSKVLDEQLGIIDPEKYIDEMTYHFTIEPDLYIFLSIDVGQALERVNSEEKYEKRERLKEASRMYHHMFSQKENVFTLSGTSTKKEIHYKAVDEIYMLLE